VLCARAGFVSAAVSELHVGDGFDLALTRRVERADALYHYSTA